MNREPWFRPSFVPTALAVIAIGVCAVSYLWGALAG